MMTTLPYCEAGRFKGCTEWFLKMGKDEVGGGNLGVLEEEAKINHNSSNLVLFRK